MKMKMAVAALGLAVVASAPAQAQDLNDRRVSPECELTITSPVFAVCGGAFSGTDAGNAADELAVENWLNAPATASPSTGGGLTGAVYGEKVDEGNTGTYFSVVPDGEDGVIEFFSPIGGTFALSLKAGSNFSIFVFNLADPVSSISYTTLGVGGAGKDKDDPAGLSHATLWLGEGGTNPFCVGDRCVPTTVPEPSSLAMMFVGLLGLGAAARRRNA